MRRVASAAVGVILAWGAASGACAQAIRDDLGASLRSGPQGYAGLTLDDRSDRGRGVRVIKVAPGGPAEKAGVKQGDLVTGLDGVRVRQMADVTAILGEVLPGQTVRFEILRDNQRRQVAVTFGRRPAVGPGASDPASAPPRKVERPSEHGELPPPGPAFGPAPQGRLPLPDLPLMKMPADAPPAAVEDLKGADAKDAQDPMEELRARIEALEQRVEQLERALAEKQKEKEEK